MTKLVYVSTFHTVLWANTRTLTTTVRTFVTRNEIADVALKIRNIFNKNVTENVLMNLKDIAAEGSRSKLLGLES